MKSKTLVRLATQSILKNKMRAALTMLGIIIGVAAVIVMVAVGYGARSRIRAQINNLGTNMIVITPGASAAEMSSTVSAFLGGDCAAAFPHACGGLVTDSARAAAALVFSPGILAGSGGLGGGGM